MRYVVYDGETHSPLDIREVGSHVYLCEPLTDVWCVSFCIVTEGARSPIRTWVPPDPPPAEILEAAADPQTLVVAHNDTFERELEARILHPRYGWPVIPIERRRCSQAVALSHALPAKLEKIADALQLKVNKPAKGKAAMKKLAKPRKPRAGEDPDGIYWHDDPKLFALLYEYNRIDVEITAEIVQLLGFLPPREQEIWQLDAAINARGLGCDVALLDAALDVAEQAILEVQKKVEALTEGEITSVAQRDRTLAWLRRHGCAVENIQKETLLEAIKTADLSAPAKRMIELRLDGAHAAVNKLNTMRGHIDGEHRICQAFRYHGAMPGRFTSLGVQLQNLKKPTEIDDTAAAIAAVQTKNLAHLQQHYTRPLDIVGGITRALIVPAPGHRLSIADLSGVESRGLAWLTGEQSKLDQWREFDRTGDPEKEPYYHFGTEELKLVGAVARSTGKTCDLAFGYQGMLEAWRRLAPAGDATPEEEVYRRRRAWVRQHPNIAKFWRSAIVQARNAIEHPGERFTVARIAFIREGSFVHLELPSGRRIRYPYARLYEYVGRDGDLVKTFTFYDASGGKWAWYHTLKKGRGAFGGLIAENATQALCRDIFVDAMLRLEAAGYKLVAHLHDEFVCEVPDGFGDLEEFRRIITEPPEWAPDFPVACKARIADRFIETKKPKAAEPKPAPDSSPGVEEESPAIVPPAAPVRPMTWVDIAEINAKLAVEGIAPLNIKPAAPPPPPPLPASPAPWDEPPAPEPKLNGGGAPQVQVASVKSNGFDATRGGSSSGVAPTEPDPGKPYQPIVDALKRRGHRLARTFEYRLPDGSVLYSEDRFELLPHHTPSKELPRKQCRFWHLAGGEQRSDTGPRRIIYAWPAIMAAGPGATVFIVEGPNKAEPLLGAGLLATAAAYHQWGLECIDALADRHLIYLEDHDHPDPKGRIAAKKYSADARAKLMPRAASFRIVPGLLLWENLGRTGEPPHGWDVKDWIEAGGEAAKLLEICRTVRDEKARRYITTQLSTIAPRAVSWIWPGHLARGGLELMAGFPEIGKSQIHCQYIACATTGRVWPDGSPGIEPCRVIILTAEDTIDDTLVPRLMAAGANLELIQELKAVRRNEREEMFLLGEDLDALEEMIRDYRDVGLVGIDPITAYMGHAKNFDSHRTTDVRSQLSPLKRLAERTGVAFSAITHPAKNAGPRALDQFIGSQAFIAAARVGHLCVAEMEANEDGEKRPTGRKLFTNPKINVAARQPTLIYCTDVVELEARDPTTGLCIKAPVVRWEGVSNLSAEEALAAAKPTPAKTARAQPVKEFLDDILTGGPVPQQTVAERGAARGFSYDQLRRAKKALDVVAFKQRGQWLGAWVWALPEHVPADAERE